jgi:hypothetical protein
MLLVTITRTVRASSTMLATIVVKKPLKLSSPTLVRFVTSWWRNNIHESLPQLSTISFPAGNRLGCFASDKVNDIIWYQIPICSLGVGASATGEEPFGLPCCAPVSWVGEGTKWEGLVCYLGQERSLDSCYALEGPLHRLAASGTVSWPWLLGFIHSWSG